MARDSNGTGAAWDDILQSTLDEYQFEDTTQAGSGGKADIAAAAKQAAAAAAQTRATAAARRPSLNAAPAAAAGDVPIDPAALDSLMGEMKDPEFQRILAEAVRSLSLGAPTAGIATAPTSGDPAAVATASLFSQLASSDTASGTDHLTRTLEMLQRLAGPPTGGAQTSAAGAAEGMTEETMRTMMEEYERLGKKDDFNGAVEGMLTQLLSKDIMYVPMKQISEKFPAWLAANRASLSPEDYVRYGKQYQFFQRLVHTYETAPDNFTQLLALMQELQELGNPPKDIIKDLAPGLELGEDGMPMMPNMGPGMPGLPTGDGACCVM